MLDQKSQRCSWDSEDSGCSSIPCSVLPGEKVDEFRSDVASGRLLEPFDELCRCLLVLYQECPSSDRPPEEGSPYCCFPWSTDSLVILHNHDQRSTLPSIISHDPLNFHALPGWFTHAPVFRCMRKCASQSLVQCTGRASSACARHL